MERSIGSAWLLAVLASACAVPVGDRVHCPECEGPASGKVDAVGGPTRLWPGGVIYMQVDPSDRDEDVVQALHESIAKLHRETPIRFVVLEHRSDAFAGTAMVEFEPSERDGLAPTVGVTNGVVRSSVETLEHELGHVIGLGHTHQRVDRDEHVRLHPSYVDAGQLSNFEIWAGVKLLGPYDFGSVMHYDSRTHSTSRGRRACATLTPRTLRADPEDCVTKSSGALFSSSTEFSAWNLIAISVLYCDRRFCGTRCASVFQCGTPAVRHRLAQFAGWEASEPARELYLRYPESTPEGHPDWVLGGEQEP